MKKFAKYFNVIGFIFLGFGVLSTLIDLLQNKGASFSIYSKINLGVGVLLLIVYLIFYASTVKVAVSQRRTRVGLNAFIFTALVLGVLILINIMSVIEPKLSFRKDLTENKVFSLSDQSEKVAKGLTESVKVIGFYNVGAQERTALRDIITRYQHFNKKLDLQLVDADENPKLAKEYEAQNGMAVIVAGVNKTKIANLTEEEITKSLIQVTKKDNKMICFLEGQGEGSLASDEENGFSTLKQFSENEGYSTQSLSLSAQPTVPTDCNVLAVVGPQSAIVKAESLKIDEYLKSGGRALFLLDPVFSFDNTTIVSTGFEDLVAQWGVEVRTDVIVYEMEIPAFLKQAFGRQVKPVALVEKYEDHPIVKDFKTRVSFPYARSLVEKTVTDHEVTQTVLFKTEPDVFWGETNIKAFKQNKMNKDGNDHTGALNLAYAVTAPIKDGVSDKRSSESRLVVFGNAEFLANSNIVNGSGANLFLNSLNWLTGEESKISIRPKLIRTSSLDWTADEATKVFYISVLLLPELILLVGLLIWKWRKNR